MKNLTLLIAFLAILPAASARAETAQIGSELLQIEGPPELVESLRESFAAGRPKAKAKKHAAKAKEGKKREFAAIKNVGSQAND